MLTLERKGQRARGSLNARDDGSLAGPQVFRGRAPSGRSIICDRFAVGPVAFEILSDGALHLEPELERYRQSSDAHPVVADVICSVAVDPAAFAGGSEYGLITIERAVAPIGGPIDVPIGGPSDGPSERPIDCPIDDASVGQELLLRGPRASCSLKAVAPQRYACSARIGSEPSALTVLIRMLAHAIVQAEGGVVLHAAGIELEGRAVLFVGPSGAGKSTAATLSEGAAMFAYDHVALVPRARTRGHASGLTSEQGCVLAYGLPGGSPARMPQASESVFPLAAIFRIYQGSTAPSTDPSGELVSGVHALFVVRESLESGEVSLPGFSHARTRVLNQEQARLQAAAAITDTQRVGVLHTVLGANLTPLLRELMAEARV